MKPVTFRIYPEHKTLFYTVVIFESHKKMLSAIKRENKGLAKIVYNDTLAFCACYRSGRSLGKIYFFRKATGVDTVTHEMFHALSGYMAARKIKHMEFTDDEAPALEERCSYAIGGMVGDFFTKYRKFFGELYQ